MTTRKPKSDWSRPLPHPMLIPGVMTMTKLADVRELMRHLPRERRNLSNWRHIGDVLDEAAGGAVDVVHLAIALRMVLMLEQVECQAE